MVGRIVLELVRELGRTPLGATVELPAAPEEVELVAAWCERTGNQLVAATGGHVVVRRGRPDPQLVLRQLPRRHHPGVRLWLYTNFDCNLACDYCCSRSSPRAPRRELGLAAIRRLVAEAGAAGVAELYLTGGEPFLLPDLDEIVATCAAALPTTLLTNGMLWRGRRLELLRRMPRQGFTLQISLDSATAERHDRHRGAGSWQRALAGIRLAVAEGFTVRVAATLAPGEEAAEVAELAAYRQLLDGIGIGRQDQLIRPVARRGNAEGGVALTIDTLIPEVTVTASGVYWHPVTAEHADQLVTTQLFPLAAAIERVRERFVDYRLAAASAVEHFPCA